MPLPANHARDAYASTYARIAALPKRAPPSVTLIVFSKEPCETSERVLNAVRNAKDQNIVLRCHGDEDAKKMERQLRTASAGLMVSTPLVEIRDVLAAYSDPGILDHLKGHNEVMSNE